MHLRAMGQIKPSRFEFIANARSVQLDKDGARMMHAFEAFFVGQPGRLTLFDRIERIAEQPALRINADGSGFRNGLGGLQVINHLLCAALRAHARARIGRGAPIYRRDDVRGDRHGSRIIRVFFPRAAFLVAGCRRPKASVRVET